MYLKQYLKQYFRYSKFLQNIIKTKYETCYFKLKDGYVVIKDFIGKEQCKLLAQMETKFEQYIQHCEDKEFTDMISKNANFSQK